MSHAWNAVLIDGKYYVADITWSNYKLTLSSESGDTVYEIVSYGNFLISSDEAARSHITYGEYDIAGGADPGYAYSIEIAPGYDTMVGSDAELIYIVNEYLTGFVSEDTDIWIELAVGDEYLNEKNAEREEGELTGYDVIRRLIAAELQAGYSLRLYNGDGVLFVNLAK